MLKEQVRTEIERIFDNPVAWHVVKNTYGNITIAEPILEVEWVADQIIALFEQSKQAALKEQMERVITDLTKILNQPTDRYIRLQDCYKYVEQLKTKMDKAELLEGENE